MATAVRLPHPKDWGIGFWVAAFVLIPDIVLVGITKTLGLPEGLVIAALCAIRL